MNRIQAVISDADGTLVDTVRLIRHGQYETAKAYFIKHGIPAGEIPSYEAYEALLNKLVGGFARNTLEQTARVLYAESPHHLESMDFEELHHMLNPVQDSLALQYVRPYDNLANMFRNVGSLGLKLAIFTSGTPHHIVRNFGIALPELGLEKLFLDISLGDDDKLIVFVNQVKSYFGLSDFVVITAAETTREKPDPQCLMMAMERLNVHPDQSMVIGDHKVDMQSAVNAGVETRIGISHGFDDRDSLEKAGATQVIDSLEELMSILKHLG